MERKIPLTKILYILTLLFLPTLLKAQVEYKLEKVLEIDSDNFLTDNLENFYTLNGSTFSKFDKNGKLLYEFSNKDLGSITTADIRNSLRPVLYYQDMNMLVVLDNTLSIQGVPINLNQNNLGTPSLVASSINNNFWIYNQDMFELTRVNRKLEVLSSTGNIGQILNRDLELTEMKEYGDLLYVNDINNGIMLFDIYGNYSKTIPEKNIDTFQPIGDYIYFTKGGKFFKYNLRTFNKEELILPEEEFTRIRLEKNKLFILLQNKLKIYTIKG